jgi:predicted ATP-grasp superfamily ATP-dependent carboligase
MIQSKLLVVAQSARMLTQLAVDAGFTPVAIDCFADSDTRGLAADIVKVGNLSMAEIMPALALILKKHPITHVTYASGFEQHAETLAFLQHRFSLWGNPPTLFKALQDKRQFFEHLTALSIAFPETIFTPPDDVNGWLRKPMRGEGGAAVTWAEGTDESDGFYWQRHLPGAIYSVLFVACAGQVQVIGFNRQWPTALDSQREFVFAGVINHADIAKTHRQQIEDWLVVLLKIYPLQGVCGLDFIAYQGQCYLLEINARIPASAQLYGKSIFAVHKQACLGEFSSADFKSVQPAAFRIVYASQTCVVPMGLVWPTWIADRPEHGAIIGKGQPICSIIVIGENVREVENQLRIRLELIENLLNTGQSNHAIPRKC